MFDNGLFDNYLDLVRQCKESFLVLQNIRKSKFELIEHNYGHNYVGLMFFFDQYHVGKK